MATSFDSVRRAITQQTAETVSLPDFMVVFRFLAVLAALTGSMGAYLWSRMEVTRMSVVLDESRSDLARAEVMHERLELERSTLRQPGRLQEEAHARALVSPKAVIQLGDVATP